MQYICKDLRDLRSRYGNEHGSLRRKLDKMKEFADTHSTSFESEEQRQQVPDYYFFWAFSPAVFFGGVREKFRAVFF